MTFRWLAIILLSGLLLSACAPEVPAPTATPAPPTATLTSVPTATPSPTAAPTATQEPLNQSVEGFAKRDARMRDGPDSTLYAEAGHLRQGKIVTVIGKYRNKAGELWYQLEDGRWVWSIWLTVDNADAIPDVEVSAIPEPLTTPAPITGEVNYVAQIKANPSAKSSILVTLYAGTEVEVLGSYHRWYKVKTDDAGDQVVGWVDVASLQLPKSQSVPEITPMPTELVKVYTPTTKSTPTPKSVKATAIKNSVNLRKGPGTEYSIADKTKAGEQYQILGQAHSTKKGEAPWYYIQTETGDKVWIRSDFIKVTDENNLVMLPKPRIPPTPKPPMAIVETTKLVGMNSTIGGDITRSEPTGTRLTVKQRAWYNGGWYLLTTDGYWLQAIETNISPAELKKLQIAPGYHPPVVKSKPNPYKTPTVVTGVSEVWKQLGIEAGLMDTGWAGDITVTDENGNLLVSQEPMGSVVITKYIDYKDYTERANGYGNVLLEVSNGHSTFKISITTHHPRRGDTTYYRLRDVNYRSASRTGVPLRPEDFRIGQKMLINLNWVLAASRIDPYEFWQNPSIYHGVISILVVVPLK